MFKEDVTQFCPECEKWARKCEKLEHRLKRARELHQWILDQWDLDTKITQDKILNFIESED